MSIRKVLVPVTGNESDKPIVATALGVCRRFNAFAEALFVRPDPSEVLPYLGEGVSGQVIEDLLQAAKEGADLHAKAALATVSQIAEAVSVPIVDGPASETLPSIAVTEVTGRYGDVVAAESRLSDLVVFGDREDDEWTLAGGAALEASLITAGRPVLIAPKAAPSSIGSRVVIGWDESSEAAHAITAAMPFLARAEESVICCVGYDEELDPESAGRLASYLALHGIEAKVKLVDAGDKAIGEVLLEQAEKKGADLIVMGGYSHSRLRELIVGGATRYIRSHATLPVMMAH